MKYYIIAGENSGDLHGSNLIKDLIKLDASAEIRGIGGKRMELEGMVLFRNFSSMAFMGFWEVVSNVSSIFKILKSCKVDIKSFNPDVIVLIDYAGFNLRIAKYAYALKIPVHYYISPKVWAWNVKRAFKIKKLVHRMYVILPFEKDFYSKFDFNVDYVGNPVKDSIANYRPKKLPFTNTSDNPIVALLPGSREQEIKKITPLFKELIQGNPNMLFLVAGVDSVSEELYNSFNYKNSYVFIDSTYDILSVSQASIVTSGTATLESALFSNPQVVVYKSSGISIAIAKLVIKVKYISLVNLILNTEAVVELIQDDAVYEKVNLELKSLLFDEAKRNKIKANYRELNRLLGDQSASVNTAKGIYSSIIVN